MEWCIASGKILRVPLDSEQTLGSSPTVPLSFSLTHLPLSVIVKQEGFLGLWKGAAPTMGRATTLAAVEMSSYDEVSDHHTP